MVVVAQQIILKQMVQLVKLQLYHYGSEKIKTISSGINITGDLTTSGKTQINDTTEATTTLDGSLQTDGGLSVAKSAVIGDDLDFFQTVLL